jgi:hypothetical protein
MAERNKWQQLLDSFQQGGGEFFFPKAGRTKIRLVVPKGRDEVRFFQPVTNSYGKTRYLVLGYVFDEEEQGDPRIRPIILPKTYMDWLINQLAEGFDLFGKNGHGVTIVRAGSGQFNTSYNGSVSAKSQPLPPSIKWPTETLEQLAEKFEQTAKQRADSRSGGGSDRPGQSSEEDWEAEESTETEEPDDWGEAEEGTQLFDEEEEEEEEVKPTHRSRKPVPAPAKPVAKTSAKPSRKRPEF